MGTLAAGIKEIFATAKTTGSNVLLCGNDGTPDGHMTMANLASVLGGLNNTVTFIDSSTNIDNLRTPFTRYQWSASIPTNAPTDYCSMIVIGVADLQVVQICTLRSPSSEYYIRYYQNEWGSWQKFSFDIPSFYKDYNSLASLANALGVTKRMEFVDLGLPSGTLWATRNLGAETPEDYGYYFSWGNVVGRKPNGTTFDYDWGTDNNGNYASTPGAALTGDIPTNMDYDAVQRYMGGSCKMPTKDQFVELFNSSYTTNEWTTKNGVNGRLVMSKTNGNLVFFPAAGYGYGASLLNAGSYGLYWSRSLSSSARGYGLSFNSSGVSPQDISDRFYGFPVRAVQ